MNAKTEALLLRLALAQTRCPNREHFLSIHPEGPAWKCPTCKGTLKMPLFPDEVRVLCPHAYYDAKYPDWCWPCKPYCGCQGRGWLPSAEAMKWIGNLFPHLRRGIDEWEAYVAAILQGDFEVALPRAIKALEIGGILTILR